ncbi:MAG: transcriptional regulator [Myxococcales bacterium]|nr:transcriptional regulator [Myxococcales bacterium]
MKLIKRYSNRKLYDTERSCYVTLDEIAVMVRQGEEVSIIDNRTGEDLTTVTLAQIVFEEEKRDRRMLPIQTLRMIIQTPGEFIQRLAKPVSDFREQTQHQVERLRRQAQAQQEEIVTPVRDFVENIQRKIDDMQVQFDQRIKDAVDALTHVPDLASELNDLKLRLASAEAEVERLRDHAGLSPLPPAEHSEDEHETDDQD